MTKEKVYVVTYEWGERIIQKWFNSIEEATVFYNKKVAKHSNINIVLTDMTVTD